MRSLLLATILSIGTLGCTTADLKSTTLSNYTWYAGDAECDASNQPPIEVFSQDPASYILRQNKCVHYEAPFMYLLFGKHKALLLDTGATPSSSDFPLAAAVEKLAQQYYGSQPYALLVMHSHSHSDHIAADEQFISQPNAQVIAPTFDALIAGLELRNWPNDSVEIQLGERLVTVIPTPGHQTEAITLYDSATRWLLTGDSVYPGRLYVRQWDEFRQSIDRLTSLVGKHDVSAVLGAHIEMDTQGNDYAAGTTFQPDETALALSVDDLVALNQELKATPKPEKKRVSSKLILVPVN